jgi:hypothetical protein
MTPAAALTPSGPAVGYVRTVGGPGGAETVGWAAGEL